MILAPRTDGRVLVTSAAEEGEVAELYEQHVAETGQELHPNLWWPMYDFPQ